MVNDDLCKRAIKLDIFDFEVTKSSHCQCYGQMFNMPQTHS
ncbi:hypothetical protein RCH20_001656 [Psychrobacter sp. PL15]|nr:hypothetical protein [Psychrobacter sp. PL15]